MKKFAPLLILLFLSTLSLSAQSRKGKKKKRPDRTETTAPSSKSSSERSKSMGKNSSSNPREDRSVAITLESGFKSLSGWGLNGSYYINPNIAVDLGLGFGAQLAKGGIRGRYLFLDKKFTPYVGAGVFFNPLPLDNVIVSDPEGFTYEIDVQSSTFAQFVAGAEYMGEKGFNVGFNLGYAASLTGDNYTSNQPLSSGAELVSDILYGSGIVIGFNLGWAF